jgi:hypothetical protein
MNESSRLQAAPVRSISAHLSIHDMVNCNQFIPDGQHCSCWKDGCKLVSSRGYLWCFLVHHVNRWQFADLYSQLLELFNPTLCEPFLRRILI